MGGWGLWKRFVEMLSAFPKGTGQFKTSCFTGEWLETGGRKTEIVLLDDGETGLRGGG